MRLNVAKVCSVLVLSSSAMATADEPAKVRKSLSSSEVEKAIGRGRIELLNRLEAILKNDPADYPVGRLAFPLAALIKAGVPATEPRLALALSKLNQLKVEKTYCAASYLLCLDALLEADARSGPTSPGATTQESTSRRSEWLTRIRQLTDGLVRSQVMPLGAWTYAAPSQREAHDFSNTQFAALGLEIGLKHGVKVPRQALESMLDLFVGAITVEGPQQATTITLDAPLEVKLGLTRASADKTLLQAPGGWGYTDPRRGRGERDKPYPSMTAAGASSLKIALDGLQLENKRDRRTAAGEQALHSAFTWIAQHFDAFVGEGRELYYTLYSLEKVGDLCGIERFGSRDWYTEGAIKLLERQRPNGGWGTYVETSFALLFLTRATRGFDPTLPPPILTGSKNQAMASHDLVFIEKARGFLSARALFDYVGLTRQSKIVPICEEAVRHYAPDARDELVPQLLKLWGPPDAVSAFARKALAEITAIEATARGPYLAWEMQWQVVRELEARKEVSAAEIRASMEKTTSDRLRGRLAGLAQRRDQRTLASFFVQQLTPASIEYRSRLHGILSLWTGAPLSPPPRDDKASWDEVAEAWRVWWIQNGASWQEKQPR